MNEFRDKLHLKTYKKGEVVYNVGQKAEHFYLLQEGTVRLDSLFKYENINKWPINKKETEWSFITKKVLRNLSKLEAPGLFGHNDML